MENAQSPLSCMCVWGNVKSWFSGRGWGKELLNFQSLAVHWMAPTSSLNCLSCRNTYQTPHSLNASPFSLENAFCSLKSASLHPLPQNRLLALEELYLHHHHSDPPHRLMKLARTESWWPCNLTIWALASRASALITSFKQLFKAELTYSLR